MSGWYSEQLEKLILYICLQIVILRGVKNMFLISYCKVQTEGLLNITLKVQQLLKTPAEHSKETLWQNNNTS